MKNSILKLVIVGSLVVAFSGCTDKEKKAKDIQVQKIIDDKEKEEEFIKNMKKKDTRRFKG